MTSFMDEEYEDEFNEDDPKELYGVRDGTLFVIDATPPMFEKDQEEDDVYFLQCIKQYQEIIKQKLVWDRQDWVGLILFGTEKWDMDPEAKNILTLQKLNLVSVGNLKEIMKIEKEKWKYYRDIASSTTYPLHDVLWHAAQAFSSIKITMPLKRVILFTCRDNPPIVDQNEKHRIRVKAMSYNDIGLQLFVVGLGDNWNHEHFYKDLEMLSQKIDTDDYKRTSLKDLLKQVKLPARNMAKLPWRLGENITLDVIIRNLCVKTKYLQKVAVSNESTIPLIKQSQLKKVGENEKNSDESRPLSPVLETEIEKYQEFGCKKICFSLSEVKSLATEWEPGIDIICTKPISYHPLFHLDVPYFVTHSKSYRKDNKLLFGALLDKCESKNLMIICSVTIRKHSAPNLYSMIPSTKNGGFYLYKIPFKENVRDLTGHLEKFVYDENNTPSTKSEDIELLAKIIKKLRIEYDPELFKNPKLQVQLQTLETEALDLEPSEPPLDDTLPVEEVMHPRVKDLLSQYNDVFNEENDCDSNVSVKKKLKKNEMSGEMNDEMIQDIITHGKVESCTVAQLKSILKNAGLKTSGKKEELIKKVKQHYDLKT